MDEPTDTAPTNTAPTNTAPTNAAPTNAAPDRPSGLSRRRARLFIAGGATALVLCVGGGGLAVGAAIAANAAAYAATSTASVAGASGQTVTPGSYLPTSPFGRQTSGTDSGSSGTTTQTSATAATDAQKLGVVTIVSDLYYSESSQAAGTGIVLTSDGQILTNNHVIEGATSIEVTVESTGETYRADVVGTDATDDVAVLQLVGASGLSPATLDDDALAVADEITSVGNAQGTGDLVAASGTVTALDENITVGNEGTGSSENLTGLIEIDAAVVSGDSGGPLVDAEGEVTGIVTAASSGSSASHITGFAIPIDTAIAIASQIVEGDESDSVSIGAPAFLGVQLAATQATQNSPGVVLGGAIAGTPAADAGLASGDVITSVDGVAVTTVDGLSAAIAAHEVGDSVTIGYTTASGMASSVVVTLMAGPAE